MAPVSLPIALFFSVLVAASPAPEPAAITAAAVLPRSPSVDLENEMNFRQYIAYQERSLVARQLKPGMHVCFGTGSICDLSLDMSCSASLDGDEWYKCYCTSGKVSLNAACQNCQDLYDLGGTFSLSDWQGYCADKGFSIAPIPASVIASWSKFNATLTYDTALPTKAGGSSNTGAAATTTSSTRRTSSADGLSALSTSSLTGRPGPVPAGETWTVSGVPTGTRDIQPLTTTTGVPPLQNAPLPQGGSSGAARAGGNDEVLRLAGLTVMGACLFFGAVLAL